ncbi:hypothetical protein RRU94_19130 [Domibacillus sp. DTU_2020_1001157_1_SI_ALB_TIR_016]|uniref:hypothetical protein n=1 Tax=Domibacillus sp. DTU_2020_1001157_1_SI_ALB_TIR_016 TaxID=3077789 RepID=UPI0028EF66F5|nr:hypothetical protein [Domibacillus sp. DTU_2020_1001157_1_SI_ALB_TIR_016]WNS79636.1 hypothetical protein RRU94_19130 [Domibacillus sp. DTU_2020_1001157_1_SI_ALB_TIR_016]
MKQHDQLKIIELENWIEQLMAYRGALTVQQWIPEEVQAYCIEKFGSKRPAYVKKAEQDDALRFSKNSQRKRNDLCLTRPNKQQYERYLKQGLTDESIINRYPHLPSGWLQEARKRGDLYKKAASQRNDYK